VKDDRDVTADDRPRFDLILYGDPDSNRLIAEALAAKSPWSLPFRSQGNPSMADFSTRSGINSCAQPPDGPPL
jgi:hypothetical protein